MYTANGNLELDLLMKLKTKTLLDGKQRGDKHGVLKRVCKPPMHGGYKLGRRMRAGLYKSSVFLKIWMQWSF